MDTRGFQPIRRREVEEVPWGMYVWQNEDGEIFGDDDGNVLNVFCMKGDRRAMKALSDAARYYGAGEGKPIWWSGKRPVTDEELAEQEMRQKLGLIPDPLDYAAVTEEMKEKYYRDK